MRVDRYLWAIRAYKTRSIAADACRSGKVKIDDISVKPSRQVKVGDVIAFKNAVMTKTIEVVELVPNRLKASLAIEKYKDLTPVEELERVEMIRQMRGEIRERGSGRPTKKERRQIDQIKYNA